MSLARELAALVGARHVVADAAALAEYARDYAGHPSGPALAAVRPGSSEQTAAVVRWARARRTPLTPVGARTSFWGGAPARGRVLVDMRRQSRVLSVDERESTVRVQAGISMKALDGVLGRRGLCLASCPDGFGTATAASLATNDCAAGHGMFLGPASGQIVALRAALGTGELVWTGGSAVLRGLPAFTRAGLPDLTGPLLASEGALGIVTELVLRARPAPRVRALSLALAPTRGVFRRVAGAARRARFGQLCHAWTQERRLGARRDVGVIQCASAHSRPELDAKVARLRALLAQAGLPEPAELAAPVSRWEDPPRGADAWAGVAVALPFAAAEEAYVRSAVLLSRAPAPRAGGVRIYFGADCCASLAWWDRDGAAERPDEARREARLRAALAPLGVPYRAGFVWREELAARLDPAYRGLLGRLKAVFDPDGVLNPGVGPFGLPGTPAR